MQGFAPRNQRILCNISEYALLIWDIQLNHINNGYQDNISDNWDTADNRELSLSSRDVHGNYRHPPTRDDSIRMVSTTGSREACQYPLSHHIIRYVSRLDSKMIISYSNLSGASATVLPRCLPIFRLENTNQQSRAFKAVFEILR